MSLLRDQVILISGCSTGIGRALAAELGARGHRVFATARRVETLADLQSERIETLPLDVCDAASIDAAVKTTVARAGRIDMLINNAGMSLAAPLAEVPLDDVRRVLETNVVGLLALTQAVFPQMARQKRGRVVNIGSVIGILPTPFGGSYCMSKAAVHMLSEVLRMEVAPFGIEVTVVQPGAVRSAIGDNASQLLSRIADKLDLYRPLISAIESRAMASQARPMEAAEFATRTCDAILQQKAPRVVREGNGAAWIPGVSVVPNRLRDFALSRRFGLDRF